MSRTTLAVALLSLFPTLSMAATLHVPGSYPTIQAAFDVAHAGDEIVLAPGDYAGPGNTMLTVPALDLTIRSEGGAGSTRIVGPGPEDEHWGFSVRPGQGNTVTVVGIGFYRLSGQQGSAIKAAGIGSLVVRECQFVECRGFPTNMGPPHAGAVMIGGQIEAEFSGCLFLRNQHDVKGAGLSFYGTRKVDITDCVFEWNDTGAIYQAAPGSWMTVSGCRFANNGRSAAVIETAEGTNLELLDATILTGTRALYVGGTAVVRSSTITRNYDAAWGTDVGGVVVHPMGSVDLENSIVRGNCVWDGIKDIQAYGRITITCCALDSTGIAGWENITFVGEQVWEDPLFCDPEDCRFSGDGDEERYRLDVNSPCTAWRSPCGTTIGALGVGCGAEALGACCIDSLCVVAPPGECGSLGGAYQGDGTTCEPGVCDPTPVIDTGWGAIKARFR